MLPPKVLAKNVTSKKKKIKIKTFYLPENQQ